MVEKRLSDKNKQKGTGMFIEGKDLHGLQLKETK